MSKENKLRELPDLYHVSFDKLMATISDIWWDEKTKVSMMADKHIENALLKLQGLGKSHYDSEPELRTRWIHVLRLEQEKRKLEAKASFNMVEPRTAAGSLD